MKQRSIMFCFLIICFVAIGTRLSVIVKANEAVVSGDLTSRIGKSLSISLLDEELDKRVVKCFDVNENGWFAIGYRGNIVNVYDQYGTFQYGYRFEQEGTYGIEFEGDHLALYLGRSDIVAVLDAVGNCIHAEEVSIPNEVFNRTAKQVGNSKYFLERDIGIFDGDYSRLVTIDETGTRKVLYDVTTKGYFAGIFHYILLFVIPIGGIILLVKQQEEKEHSEDSLE